MPGEIELRHNGNGSWFVMGATFQPVKILIRVSGFLCGGKQLRGGV